MSDCGLCGGGCAGSDLQPLIDPRLRWLWHQLGRAADRHGDPHLTDRAVRVTAPAEAELRAAAIGLLGGRALTAGQTRTVSLDALTRRIRIHGPTLTPGVVAAHATGRPLATRAHAKAARASREQQLLTAFTRALPPLDGQPLIDPQQVWEGLRRARWLPRLLARDDAEQLLSQAAQLLAALPSGDQRVDRRRIAAALTANPHALDDGAPLAGLTLAILAAANRVPAGQPPRAAWRALGVDYDTVTGGLITVGLLPIGWSAPPAAVLTLPPRELATSTWPGPPDRGAWVFVTENPSIAAAAADLAAAAAPRVRLLCTAGTPSAEQIDAISRLSSVGWRIAVRADFDAAGLRHVTALLAGAPTAQPWRMHAEDYTRALAQQPNLAPIPLDPGPLPDTWWDSQLPGAMLDANSAVYEESMLDVLLLDLAAVRPGGTEE